MVIHPGSFVLMYKPFDVCSKMTGLFELMAKSKL